MASSKKNLSTFTSANLVSAKDQKFGIIVSEWNSEVTEALYAGAYRTLVQQGVARENITKKIVPGSFELCIAAQWMAAQHYHAIICLGCVIQGETKHFDFICQAVANGLVEVSLKFNKAVVFGVLTTNTQQQALDRAGGKYGNKGDEAAATALKMVNFGA